MITTNYEISKQLAEAGFAYDYDCGYTHKGKLIDIQEQMGAYHIETPSYDLETILTELPEWIHDKEKCSSEESLELTKDYIQYSSTLSYNYHRVDRKENESLADTAARLWLKLKKENLI